MKQNLRLAVNLTALVLAAGLLMGLLTGCPQKVNEKLQEAPKYNYKVEHLQQNITDDDYTLYETETLNGKEGETSSAAAKTYEGFTVQTFSQAAIKADGSTVVQIKYNRNIITLKLNLDGGTTSTYLEDGNKLQGRFGAKVELKELKKSSNILDKWEPELPTTFPASSPAETYTASWTNQSRITVKGDERTNIPSDTIIKIDLAPAKTWSNIKAEVESKINLKTEWQGGDYEIYEWRLGGETGEKISDNYPINNHITVYAVTNYAKFNIEDNKIKLTAEGKGYTGSDPKGKIIIPENITEIEDKLTSNKGAFENCTKITSIRFPASLTTIGSRAFFSCGSLTRLDISGCTNLTIIGKIAFAKCAGLKSIELPANLTRISEGAFNSCKSLTSIGLPANLTTIGKWAFSGCKDLTSVEFPASLTTIGKWAFADCEGLASVGLPANLNKIGHKAFSGCKGLISVEFPANLTTIDSYAFVGCIGLTSVEFPASLTEIGECAFSGCTNLTSLTIDSSNSHYKSENNILYTKHGETLVLAAGGLTSVDIPNTVTTIGRSAFHGCMSLTSIELPANLTTIDEWAFSGCTSLTSIEFPASLTKICYEAFFGCTGLTSAVFANTNGWKVYEYGGGSYIGSISSSDLADASKAAEYLREEVSDGGYCDKYWKKN